MSPTPTPPTPPTPPTLRQQIEELSEDPRLGNLNGQSINSDDFISALKKIFPEVPEDRLIELIELASSMIRNKLTDILEDLTTNQDPAITQNQWIAKQLYKLISNEAYTGVTLYLLGYRYAARYTETISSPMVLSDN